jgi:hypothetical protein
MINKFTNLAAAAAFAATVASGQPISDNTNK